MRPRDAGLGRGVWLGEGLEEGLGVAPDAAPVPFASDFSVHYSEGRHMKPFRSIATITAGWEYWLALLIS